MAIMSPPILELLVLGSVEASIGGRRLALGGVRQRALLALLTLEPGRPVAVDRLVDEIWAGEPPGGAEVTVRSYVSRLRRTLGPAAPIRGSAAGYLLEVEPDTVDARRFERLVREANDAFQQRLFGSAIELIRKALGLWRGDPYADLDVDRTLRVEAERLEELRLHAVERRLEADLELGGGSELVDELEAQVRRHPHREAFWRQLMLALYRSERQADALATYHRARDALDEQLGIEPGEELQALERAILRHDVPAVTRVEERHNLPAPLTTFVGRRVEIEAVKRHLAEARLVALTGVGGVGKTRLAIETARGLTLDYPDGVFFVDLAPIAESDLVAGHVAVAIGLREEPGVSAEDRLAAALRSRIVLLVLDNCEHVLEVSAALVARLLAASPRLRVLATSRRLLGVPGERDVVVPPLEAPSLDDVAAARASEAVRLFLARAREAHPSLADDDATIAAIARICSDLDGLPLAIELAAARTRALSPPEIAARLADRFRFLVSWRRVSAARHRTLREAMDWSHGLLGRDEQRMLAELSVFSGGATIEGIEGVATAAGSNHTLDLVERLVEASLVIADQATQPTRYRMLETVRQYAADRLAELGATDELRDRHATHYRNFAEAAAQPLRDSATRASTLRRLDDERENLRAALAWSREVGRPDDTLRMAEALWWYWWIRGALTEGRNWLEIALDGAASSEPMLRGRAHLGLAGLEWAQKDLPAAGHHGEAALALFEALDDTLSQASALNTLGLIAHARMDLPAARRALEESVRRNRGPGRDQEARARALPVAIDNLGSLAHEMGDDDEAIARYDEARSMNVRLGDVNGVAMNDLHLAVIAAEQGRWDDTRELLSSAMRVYRGLGFVQYAAECLETAAILANGTGAFLDAAVMLAGAGRMRDQAGSPPVPFFATIRDRESRRARAGLGDEGYKAALESSWSMTPDAITARALEMLGR